ncbi:acetyltransferase [Thiomonas sp.]|uniref:acetyltransferase n=1 Tax=Thiomonas sp. TaxID=2047785 RepID=UPI00262A36C6|nr:acetyltransferase [Thiomonas sp.]
MTVSSPSLAHRAGASAAPGGAPLLVVFGAGGHGRVAADAALASGRWSAVLACDREPALWGSELLPGLRVLAPRSLRELPRPWGLHVAIGDNASRRREARALLLDEARAAFLASVIHPLAALSPSAEVGPGCLLAAHCVVGPLALLGEGVIVNHTAVVDHDCTVGAWAHVAPGARLGGAVRVGAAALLGSGCSVLPGLRVGEASVLGAGAVALRDLPDSERWAGVPARATRAARA